MVAILHSPLVKLNTSYFCASFQSEQPFLESSSRAKNGQGFGAKVTRYPIIAAHFRLDTGASCTPVCIQYERRASFHSSTRSRSFHRPECFAAGSKAHGPPLLVSVKSLAMEAMEEEGALVDLGKRRSLGEWSQRGSGLDVSFFQKDLPDSLVSPPSFEDSNLPPIRMPMPPRNRADDSKLNNPLKRLERMGGGWFGVVMEWEGVVLEDDGDLERKAWAAVAQEEGKPQPLAFVLKRAEGMKNEQAVSEVLCWGRDPFHVRRLARRKEELYEEMQGGTYRVRPGSREFVEGLKRHRVPVGIASTRPRESLERAIEAVGMEGFFDVVVAAEDCYRGKPDPEMFQYAVQLMGFIPERMIVIGNNNACVEAAHDALMKCVAVSGKHPSYELGSADLVVRNLDGLSIMDLKRLANVESPEFLSPEEVTELEYEAEEVKGDTAVAVMDWDDDSEDYS